MQIVAKGSLVTGSMVAASVVSLSGMMGLLKVCNVNMKGPSLRSLSFAARTLSLSFAVRANTVDLCAGPRRLTEIAAHHIRSEGSHLVKNPKLAFAINVNLCLFKQPIFP